MIMMRSTPSTKMGKPPPPVPPRPSKTLVAEALAKTRKLSPDTQKSAPIRTAPPPPNEINRSKSTISVNVNVQKPTPLERSISEEVKCSTRTVIFQSPKIEAENKKRVEIKKVDSLREEKEKKLEKVESFKSGKKIVKTESFKKENDDKLGSVENKQWDQMLNDRNHVNTLIDEMFASVLEVSANEEDPNKITINTNAENSSPTVVVIDDKVDDNSTNSSTLEKKKVQFDDRMNHELLISELESMRIEDEKILKRQRMPSRDIYDNSDSVDVSKIQHSDWVEVSDGQEVRLSSCQITIEDLKNEDDDQNKLKLDYERIKAMSSLHGLPPLPKSLSGFNLLDGQTKPPTPVRTTSMRGQTPANMGHLVYPPHPKINGATEVAVTPASGRKSTNLDTQLAILRREMFM
ncbi:uncharacterized protein BDFB_006416 [Asbolus verrucosus]|uniref:Uncharacterized protein n=1 Tax=Asbolus verrucosus TaxID=1661398 RepID=A0A482V7W9_ASBVE|nr:uncharacterized protein BDFB_006416 [Asbolus verrucosus]